MNRRTWHPLAMFYIAMAAIPLSCCVLSVPLAIVGEMMDPTPEALEAAPAAAPKPQPLAESELRSIRELFAANVADLAVGGLVARIDIDNTGTAPTVTMSNPWKPKNDALREESVQMIADAWARSGGKRHTLDVRYSDGTAAGGIGADGKAWLADRWGR